MSSSTRRSFRAFLAAHRRDESAQGDFARDWLADENAPRGAPSRAALRLYLMMRDACDGALEAADAAWLQWKAEKEGGSDAARGQPRPQEAEETAP